MSNSNPNQGRSPKETNANKLAPTGSAAASTAFINATAKPSPFQAVKGGGNASVPMSAAAAFRRKVGG